MLRGFEYCGNERRIGQDQTEKSESVENASEVMEDGTQRML